MQSELDQRLTEAIDFWFRPTLDLPVLLEYWRGNGDLSVEGASLQPWQLRPPGRVVVLEYAKQTIKDNDQVRQNLLLEQCSRLLTVQAQNSFTSVAQALCAIASAAVRFKQYDYPNAASLVGLATTVYDRCWGIFKQRICKVEAANVVPPATLSPALHLDDDALQLLSMAEAGGCFGLKGTTSSSWLTVYHALRYLFGQADLFADDNRRPLKMLLADQKQSQGHVAHLYVHRGTQTEVSFSGPFIDCRSFGITVPTPKFSSSTNASEGEMLLRSINLAWRCCRQSIQLSPNVATMFRLGIDQLHAFCGTLGGSSASGLMAVGMIASAEDRLLDPECTTTCSLSLTKEAIAKDPTRVGDESQTLHRDEVELRSVGYVPEKIVEAWKVSHGLRTFLLHQRDIDRWKTKHPNSNYPILRPVSTLADLWEAFRSADSLETELERLTEDGHQVWSDAQKAVADEKSLNPLVQHRLDCYVPPSFRVEGIDRKSVDKHQNDEESDSDIGDNGTRAIQSQQYAEATIPSSQDDDDLIHLLALSLRGAKWPDQPTWVKPNRHLVIYDNAGAGKTVCSLRLQNLLTDKIYRKRIFGCSEPPLVVHQDEYWPREYDRHGRPLTLVEMLESRFAKLAGRELEADREHVKKTVAYALRSKRVVLILDGWDQFSDSDRQHVAKIFQHFAEDNCCKWIITSRVHAIESSRKDGLFDEDKWLRVRIDPFSEEQQDRYFNSEDATGKIIGSRWTQMVDREAMKELLGLPMILAMLRILIEESPDNKPLPIFESLSQLYLITSRKLLVTALKKNVEPIQKRLTDDEWRTFESLKEDAERLTLLEHVLSLYAFQMLILQEYNARMYGEEQIKQFEKWCMDRYFRQLRLELDDEKLPRSKAIDLEDKYRTELRLWKIAVEVLKAIELNHRSVTEAYGQTVLAFRSRKVMECLAARYLTCYATEHDIFGDRTNQCWNLDPETNRPDVLKLAAVDFVTDPEWAAMWELAINMPSRSFSKPAGGVFSGAVINHTVTCTSLSLLFDQPKPYRGKADEYRELRPTRLLYQAWHLFEFDERLLMERRFNVDGQFITGEELSQKYGRGAFERHGRRLLLGEMDAILAKRLSTVCEERESVLERFRQSSRSLVRDYEEQWNTNEPSFIQLADPEDPRDDWDTGEFTMGAPDGEEPECDGPGEHKVNPQHVVNLSPYRLHRYCVTNAEYELFDPAHEWHREFGDAVDVTSHPVVNVSWYDVWCFSRWIGELEIESNGKKSRYTVSLPSEAQWEYGCRCGSEEPFTWHNRQNGDRIESGYCNFDGNNPWPREKAGQGQKGKVVYLERTISADGSDEELVVERNPWGLYQMHGNVWEWCFDWSDGRYYRRSPERDPIGPLEGQNRVLRGGCWLLNFGEYLRSGFRFRLVPYYRGRDCGFRLAAVLKSQAGQSSEPG